MLLRWRRWMTIRGAIRWLWRCLGLGSGLSLQLRRMPESHKYYIEKEGEFRGNIEKRTESDSGVCTPGEDQGETDNVGEN